MPYIGNYHVTGDTASNFRLLDDISSFTQTINPSASGVIDTTNDRIQIPEHRFVTGQRVTYGNGGGSDIGGLSNAGVYYIIKYDRDHIRLATSASNASNNIATPLSGTGSGTAHTLNVAFDGVNKVFRPTKDNGSFCRVSRPAQLQISINGVIQKPNPTAGTPTEGFKIDAGGNIEFATAPTNIETFWGQIVAEALATFDIADNELDTFTGDGNQTDFPLSRTVPNDASVIVTIDGVVQHATDNQGIRAYSVYDTILAFNGAPAHGAEIQVRHIGFASPVNSDVTSFHGRVGPVTIIDTDPVVAIQSGGQGIGTVRTINFVGAGNSIRKVGDVVEITIAGSGGGGGSGEVLKETFNVVGTQTVFNITNGQYDAGYLEVYLNGVKLPQEDFTENPPTQFTLDVAAEAGDIVEILGFKTFGSSTTIDAELSNLNVTGIVTAGQFVGDGSRISGVIGLGTQIVANTPVLGNIFYRNNTLSVGSTVTMDVPNAADSNVGYTHHADLSVEDGADFIVADGDEFITDVLGIGTDSVPLTGNGGRVRADNFTNRAGNGPPTFPFGIQLGGSSGINDEENDDGFITIQDVLDVTEDKTVAGSTTSTVIVKRKAVAVASTKSLILGPDCELVIDVYKL